MNNLVIMKNHQAVTTSLQVAESFNKRHDHLLRDIKGLEKDIPNFGEMFAKNTEQDSYGRNRQTYLMNRDGFTLLAMGFTGKKALQFKLQYIFAFNEMETAINSENKPMSIPEQIQTIAKGYTELETDVKNIKLDVSDVKNRMGLPGNLKRDFSKLRNKKVIELMGGAKSNAYLDKKLRHSVYSQMFVSFKDQFPADSYADCPMKDYDAAIKFVNNWFLPYELQTKVQQLNSQTDLFDDEE